MSVHLTGLPGRAAAVARIALIPFVVFYVPYVAFEAIALGVLGQELNGLPAAQRNAVAPGLVEESRATRSSVSPVSSGRSARPPASSPSSRR
jgi:hypothetical protein